MVDSDVGWDVLNSDVGWGVVDSDVCWGVVDSVSAGVWLIACWQGCG